MLGFYFSDNGKLKPLAEAKVFLDDINYAYGFGVYETLKARKGVLFFPEMHAKRLLHSSKIIGLKNNLRVGGVVQSIKDLMKANNIIDANIKILLIGGNSIKENKLYILCVSPLFVDKKLYQQGVKVITYFGERIFPQAKTLDMLASVLAYREAQRQGAYDALLYNREGLITEGTRTNLFFTKEGTIFTPPAKQVLEGVTRNTLIPVIRKLRIRMLEKELKKEELEKYSGYFLTSTSSKVLPISQIDKQKFGIPEIVKKIMIEYNTFLDYYVETQKFVSLQRKAFP